MNDTNADRGDRTRLERLLKSGCVIPYIMDNADREHPGVRWCVYGAPETNELFVSATNGPVVFVRAVASAVIVPPMCDRVFGIDVRDLQLAGDLTAIMWRDHRGQLKSAE